MNSVEIVKQICKNRKIPISRLEKDLKYSNGYIGQLRKGTFPSDRLVEISNYLNVNPEYLMTGQEIQFSNLTSRDERDISKDLENIRKKLASGDNGPASYDGQELSPEASELFMDEIEIALKRLKIINKEKYNPNKNKK